VTDVERAHAIGRVVVPAGVPDGFRVFYTTIDFEGTVDERIRDFVRPATPASCHQVHGIAVRQVESGGEPPRSEVVCDALWSDRKNVALVIKVADCLPVSLIDPSRHAIANIHSGWRGAVQNIVAATLDAAPLDPATSFAFLGPSIRVCCFEVGEEVASQFDPRFVDRTRGSKPHVDIPAFTLDVLRRRGVSEERMIDPELCTRCEGSVFHSYRRDKRSGRNLAIVCS